MTVTVNEQLPVLPAASVAEQVTVVVPTGKAEPDAGVQTGVIAPSHPSFAVAVKLTTAEHCPASLLAVMGDGQVTVGASSSVTVTVKLHCALLPAASVAEQVTVVAPTGKVEPEAGEQTGVIAPSHPSFAVEVKLTTAEHSPSSVPVIISAGQLIKGGVVSAKMFTVRSAIVTNPCSSITESVTELAPSGAGQSAITSAVIAPSVLVMFNTLMPAGADSTSTMRFEAEVMSSVTVAI